MRNPLRRFLYVLWTVLFGSVGSGVAAQSVQMLTQNAPLQLESFALDTDGATAELAVSVSNVSDEKRIIAIAVGVVMVDTFNDAITVHYARWTQDLEPLPPGETSELTSRFTETRAGDLALSVPFVYAVRFGDGEVWKQDLSGVATELLSRFEVAVSSTTLQP